MKAKLSRFINKLSDALAHKIPSPLLSFFSRPASYYSNTHDVSYYESARMINLAFAFCMNNKVNGDFAEFGVYEGRLSREAFHAARRNGFDQMRFFAFDSFEGLPVIDGSRKDVFHAGQFASSRLKYEKNLKGNNVDLSRFRIVEGFYDKTLTGFQDAKQISIAWIDCDLYESTVPVLDFLADRLVHGSILIFDDWFCYDGSDENGEQRACKEWLQKNPQIRLIEYNRFHWAGISFIVNRK
jgi:O-methyltransferase